MIPVTKPFLPPQELYSSYMDSIWESNWLTNNGPLLIRLESKLKDYLNVPNICFLGNGTIAIQIAIKALKLKGKILTTPFSYVATTSSIIWENCSPTFVDIDIDTFNIDADLIEQNITSDTSAILATHVFGNPCDVLKIEAIAKKHNLKVIYDAAHCFNTKYEGKSVLNYGDISTISFHATKLFHTTEGGAIVTNNDILNEKVGYLRNFGHDGPFKFNDVGINGKNSEFHAAMGLCNLEFIEEILVRRKEQYNYYKESLENLKVSTQKLIDPDGYNYAYFPILFENETILNDVVTQMNKNNVFPRRYFYPSLNKLEYISSKTMFNAESVASRVLCLPLYHDLLKSEQDKVLNLIYDTI